MQILIVNCVEWGAEHLGENLPPVCSMDVGLWIRRAFGDPTAHESDRFSFWNIRKEPSEPPESFEGVVISGSSASAYDDESWIGRLAGGIRGWAERGVPVLGICFGHQIVAQALGGKVIKNPLGWELGTEWIELTDEGKRDPLFAGLPGRFKAMESHQDIVAEPPPGAVCLARNSRSANQSLRIGEHIRTVQFHPEYTLEEMRFLMIPRRERLAAAGVDVDAALGGLEATAESAKIIANYRRILSQPSSRQSLQGSLSRV